MISCTLWHFPSLLEHIASSTLHIAWTYTAVLTIQDACSIGKSLMKWYARKNKALRNNSREIHSLKISHSSYLPCTASSAWASIVSFSLSAMQVYVPTSSSVTSLMSRLPPARSANLSELCGTRQEWETGGQMDSHGAFTEKQVQVLCLKWLGKYNISGCHLHTAFSERWHLTAWLHPMLWHQILNQVQLHPFQDYRRATRI